MISSLRNQKGFLALDFVFGLSLAGGALLIALAMCLTLTVIEVAQYVAFSTSRAFYAAHASPEAQANQAFGKFTELTSKPVMKSLFRGNWFSLSFMGADDYTPTYNDVTAIKSHNPLQGTEVQVDAKILGFNIPFFGRTTSTGEGLQTAVNSYLGREPSNRECREFNKKRWEKLKAAADASAISSQIYYVIADNGC